MPTSDYYFTNIQPEPVIIPTHWGNNSWPKPQQAAARDPTQEQADTLQPGICPSMLTAKQVPVLDLTNSMITSTADLETAFEPVPNRQRRILIWWRRTPNRRKYPLTTYQTASLLMRKLIQGYAPQTKKESTAPLKDQPKPPKQHYHTLLPSVILLLKEDLLVPKIKPLSKQKAKDRQHRLNQKISLNNS